MTRSEGEQKLAEINLLLRDEPRGANNSLYRLHNEIRSELFGKLDISKSMQFERIVGDYACLRDPRGDHFLTDATKLDATGRPITFKLAYHGDLTDIIKRTREFVADLPEAAPYQPVPKKTVPNLPQEFWDFHASRP